MVIYHGRGCNRASQNKEAIRQSVVDYVAGKVNVGAMDVDVTSVTFKGGSAPFLAQLQAIQEDPTTPGVCFPGINCTGLTLTTDLHLAPTGTFSATKPILWTAVVAANNTNVVAVHTYDPVSLTSSAPRWCATGKWTGGRCSSTRF